MPAVCPQTDQGRRLCPGLGTPVWPMPWAQLREGHSWCSPGLAAREICITMSPTARGGSTGHEAKGDTAHHARRGASASRWLESRARLRSTRDVTWHYHERVEVARSSAAFPQGGPRCPVQ